MWEPVTASYPPETHPSGVRQPPPRRPPAPPGTAGAVPNPRRRESLPYTLQTALLECLLHVRSIRLSFHGEAEFRTEAGDFPEGELDHLTSTMQGMREDARRYLRTAFDRALLRLLTEPGRFPDADYPSTKSRLVQAIRQGAHLKDLFNLLEQLSFFGERLAPEPTLSLYRLPQPAGCPEWALDLLPPRSLVRWVMEDVDRALNVAENYESLERFDVVIAFPLAALTAALPSRGIVPPYGPDR